jgi:hypothetical protein
MLNNACSIGKGVLCGKSFAIFGFEMLLLKNMISRALWKKFTLSLIRTKRKWHRHFLLWIAKVIFKDTHASFCCCRLTVFAFSHLFRKLAFAHRKREERLRERGKKGGVLDGEDGVVPKKTTTKTAWVSSFHSLLRTR